MEHRNVDLSPAELLPILPGHHSPGRFERVLRAGKFAVTTELAPPDSADPAQVYERASVFDGYVDAINATDGSGANCHMSSIAVCGLLTRAGYSPIMQISCRDRNRIAIQGEILGASAMGVSNILCLTGDGVQAGDHPQAKPVFDLDCMSLLEMATQMRDEKRFESGRKLDRPPAVFLGAAANPFAPPFDWRPLRLAKKIAAGAQFVQTQYCFDIEFRTATWIRNNVPGVHIPDSIINRLSGATDQRAEGVNICIDLIQQVREIEGVHGCHIMAYKQEQTVPEIVERSGILKERRATNNTRPRAIRQS